MDIFQFTLCFNVLEQLFAIKWSNEVTPHLIADCTSVIPDASLTIRNPWKARQSPRLWPPGDRLCRPEGKHLDTG